MADLAPPGQKWAASLVVSRVRAAGIEEDEKDMRKRVTRGRPDAKVRKLMAASSTAQPPGVVKTLTDDKKRKRLVKKRRGKKLTVAESEAESEAEAEAEAARSSKRRSSVAVSGGPRPIFGTYVPAGAADRLGRVVPVWGSLGDSGT
eukprot:jgi/Tetstr1/440274/TSEL_028624.t1